MPQYNPNDLQNRDIAIRTIIGEDPSDQGAVGVAAVLLNRLAAGTYGNSIDDVVLAKDQFEAWPRQKESLLGISTTDPRYVKIGRILDGLASGQIPDPTNGATHFYGPTSQAALGRQPPEWGRTGGQKLGGSLFFAPQGRVSYQQKFGTPGKYPRPDWMAPTGNTTNGHDLDALIARVTGKPKTEEFPRPDWMAPLPEPQLHDRPPLRADPEKPSRDLWGEGVVSTIAKPAGDIAAAVKAIPGETSDISSRVFQAGRENVAAGVAGMKSGNLPQMAEGAVRDVLGTVQEGAAPLTGAAVAGWDALQGLYDKAGGDPMMAGIEAPHVAEKIPSAEVKPGWGITESRAATEGPKAVEEALKVPSEPPKAPNKPPIAAPTPSPEAHKEYPRPSWMAPRDEATDVKSGSLSAAQSPPPAPLPARPTKQTVREAEESFGRLRGERTADQAKWDNYVQAMPAELRTPEMDELFYRYSEGDPTAVLTPERKLLWDKYAAPLKKHELASFEEAKKTDLPVEDYDPTYVHRIPKGSHPAFDRLTGDAQTADPVMGQGRLPKSTSSMNPRVFHAIQSSDGDRLLVARDDDGNLRVILKGQPAYPIKLDTQLKKGESFKASIMTEEPAKLWTLTDAHTSEIERETDIQYHKSFFGNTIDNIEKLDAVNRAVAETRRLLNSPEWSAYAMPYGEWMDLRNKGDKADWIVPKMPTFWGHRVDPKYAHVIDDFYGREPLLKALSAVNRAVVGTMFWSPFTHGVNAASHWTTARGWDWVKGPGLKSVFVDGARAATEVVGLGPKYQELLRSGSGLIYGSVVEANHYERIMRALGHDIVHNPSKWGQVADALGVSVTFLPRMLYGASSRALWAFSDVLMMQRVLELERKGMDLRTAISETEHHIPPYKTRSEILGSRTAAIIYQDPTLFQFSRYHIGALESHAHMARAMIEGGKTPLNESRRFEALGNYMAIAFGVVMFNPGINWIIQETTGNKDAKWMARGSTTIPSTLVDKGVHALAGTEWGKKNVPKFWADYYNGNSSWVIALENLVPFAPFLRGGIEALNDRLNFSGQTIVEPADAAHMRIWRMIGQGAGYLGEQMFQPMDAAMRAWRGAKPGENVAGKVARQVLEGGLNVSEPNVEGQKKVQKYQEHAAATRAKKPRDVLEEVGLWMDKHMPPWLGGSAR